MSRKTNPHVVRFLHDNCIIETDAETLHKELWQKYCEWTHIKRMRHTLCPQSFYQNCKKAGFTPVSDGKRVLKWKGVMLKPVTFEDDSFVELSSDIAAIPLASSKAEKI